MCDKALDQEQLEIPATLLSASQLSCATVLRFFSQKVLMKQLGTQQTKPPCSD